MALDLTIRYPGQIDTTTDPTGYPYGKPKNKSTAVSQDGTPLEKDIVGDVVGFEQALLKQAGITPSGNPDKVGASQYLQALGKLFPAAVDNWSEARYAAPANTFLWEAGGRLFSIGTERLGFMMRQPPTGAVGPFSYSDLEYSAGTWVESPHMGLTLESWIQPAYGDGVVMTLNGPTAAFRKTANLGAAWSSGGSNPTAADHIDDARLHYFAAAGLWQLIADSGGDNYISRDADASGTWTLQAAPAAVLAWASAKCLDIVSNANECLALFTNGYVLRTPDGTSWAAVLLPSFAGSVTGIAWSDYHNSWAVAGTSGQTWFSPTGASWTAGPTHSWTATAGVRIACLGPHWVLPADGYLARFDLVSSVAIPERIFCEHPPATAGVTDIHKHGDRLVIAYKPTATNNLIYKLSNRLVGA